MFCLTFVMYTFVIFEWQACELPVMTENSKYSSPAFCHWVP